MFNKSQLSKDLKAAREPKKLARPKDKFVIPGAPKVDPNGYWDPANVGRVIEVPLDKDSRSITMSYPDGTPLDQPLIGVGTDTGMMQHMMPGQDYIFPDDKSVIEYPNDQMHNIPLAEAGGTIMELDDDEIKMYRDAGYVVDLTPYPDRHNPANAFSVKDPRSMQPGGPVTAADSSMVAANAQRVMDFYKSTGNYKFLGKDLAPKNYWQTITDEVERYSNLPKIMSTIDRHGTVSSKVPTYKVLSKPEPDKNKIYARELANYYLNTKAPMSLYDRRITPQYRSNFRAVKGNLEGDEVDIFMYDPLAITPAAKLTDAEIIKRYKKFGASGIPESRLINLGLVKSTSTTKPRSTVEPVEDSKKQPSNMVKVNGQGPLKIEEDTVDENGNIQTNVEYYDYTSPEATGIPAVLGAYGTPLTTGQTLGGEELITTYQYPQYMDQWANTTPEGKRIIRNAQDRLREFRNQIALFERAKEARRAKTSEERQKIISKPVAEYSFEAGGTIMDGGGSYVDNQMVHFQDGGNMDPGNNALELHMFYDKNNFADGGSLEYQVGDEVDQATYEYLKSIGYEFE